MVLQTRFELAISSLKGKWLGPLAYWSVEPIIGIEPIPLLYESNVLPLNYIGWLSPLDSNQEPFR